jgi:hypothetical protein
LIDLTLVCNLDPRFHPGWIQVVLIVTISCSLNRYTPDSLCFLFFSAFLCNHLIKLYFGEKILAVDLIVKLTNHTRV